MKKIIRNQLRKLFHSYALPAKEGGHKFKREFIPALYLKSLISSSDYKYTFDEINTFCIFIGYPRSGHSLVGALLDAHPNAVIAHEADILGLVEMSFFSQKQIFSFLMDRSKEFAKAGLSWSGYDYVISNQWQGKFSELKIIGDKKGGHSTLRFGRSPELFEKLHKRINAEIKFIHHIRNPYDNIITMQRWIYAKNKTDLRKQIDLYFKLCETVNNLKEKIKPENLFEQKHEYLIANPAEYLKELCSFLAINITDDYIKDCSAHINESPNKSRYKLEWKDDDLEYVQSRIQQYDFLKGYKFDD